MKKINNTGFTLVELLVVASIISLLAAIVLSSITTGRTKARDAKRLEEKNQVIAAFHLYYNTYNAWPDSNAGGTAWTCLGPSVDTCGAGGLWFGSDALVNALKPYISALPTTGAEAGTAAYNRLAYHSNLPADFFVPNEPVGAYLMWVQEKPIPASTCPSVVPVSHPDKYYYCYEFLGSK